MIYKGIVEKVLGKQVIVRIPKLHKSSSAIGTTNVGQLSSACICTLPGVQINLQVNDVVFVDFEDELFETPVIIGTLYGFKTTSRCDIKTTDLKVDIQALLPKDTTIGEIKYSHLKKLIGITDNIQSKFDRLSSIIEEQSIKINKLEKQIKDLTT